MFPGGVSFYEMLVVGIIALLLFGKRLPEVAKSLGKGLVEFKKGMRGIEDEVRSAVKETPRTTSSSSTARRPEPEDDIANLSAPKFEPPTSEPHKVS